MFYFQPHKNEDVFVVNCEQWEIELWWIFETIEEGPVTLRQPWERHNYIREERINGIRLFHWYYAVTAEEEYVTTSEMNNEYIYLLNKYFDKICNRNKEFCRRCFKYAISYKFKTSKLTRFVYWVQLFYNKK